MTKIHIGDFNGKIALITGGSSGIGLATARLLAEQGAHVWVLARRTEPLAEALNMLEGSRHSDSQKFGILPADVTDFGQVEDAISQVKKAIGVPDLLVNSAGGAQPGYFQETNMDIFHWMMDVNFFGTVHVIKTLLPDLIARRSGYIVNISSLAGVLGVFGYTAYGAAKFAVRGFSDTLRAEMKKYRVGVSIVYPPDTDTPQLAYENQFKPFETKAISGNAGKLAPEVVANAILTGVTRGRYIILPGFESKLIYRLSGLLGEAINPFLDYIVAQAQQKSGASQ